jgi:hypothetical protein
MKQTACAVEALFSAGPDIGYGERYTCAIMVS